jgi:signal transduction histidine kinase/CheY-like chemotaxis protein
VRVRDRRSLIQASLVFVAVAGVGALGVAQLERIEVAKRRNAASELAWGSAFAIEQRFAIAFAGASTLATMVATGATEDQIGAVAAEQLELAHGDLSLQLARDGVITRIWPLRGNETAIGLDLVHHPLHGAAVQKVIGSRQPTLYGPVALIQGGNGFALRVPVFVREGGFDRFWGLSSAVIRVNALLQESRVPRLVATGLDYAIWRDAEEGEEGKLLASSVEGMSLAEAVSVPVELPGQSWTIYVVPRRGWHDTSAPGALPAAVLVISLLAAVLAYRIQALPVLLRQEVAARTQELERAHAEQRRAEEAQRQSQKLESIGLLAGGVAHDFNNLLVGILSYADLLAEQAAPGSTEDDAARTIKQAARRAAELTRQLLALARLGQHRDELVDLHALVGEAARLLERTLDKSIRLEARLTAPAHAVRGDPGQLQQVILNLAVNARDAMPDGGTLTLETAIVERDEATAVPGLSPVRHVSLAVTDSGVGIAPPHLGRLFEPFFTTKAVGKGTGLGLATAFGIVKSHGGTIRVQSELGVGTRFAVYFPVAEASTAEAPREPAPPRRGTGVVLVVDDEEVVRRTAARILSYLGYEPALASGGREALEWLAARAEPPAAVLLDLVMPEMDGRACFRGMRARFPALRVVVTSGFSSTDRVHELLADGAVAFVQKPYHLSELAEALAEGAEPPPWAQ